MGKLILDVGDIIDNVRNMDAIINPQNKYMINGSGICGAIYRASGPELLEYCQTKFKNEMQVGEIRVTPGFRLPCEIIHVLAPKYYEETEPIEKLIESYDNILKSIKLNQYKNVLIPSIGTGIHGYKHEQVSNSVISKLLEFCNENDVNIYFNNMHPAHSDPYLIEFLKLNNLNLYNDLIELDLVQIKEYLIKNNLWMNEINKKYKNFVNSRELDDICLTEKLMTLQYTIENFKVSKNDIIILIESMRGE